MGTRHFAGTIDEVESSDVALSAAWIATAYSNQSSPSTFISLGAPQTNGGSVSITVTSVPVGLAVTVDSSVCTTPCAAVQWTPGTVHTIAAANQAGAAGTQYLFGSWSDGGAASHSVTAPASATTYTASFTTQYFLTTAASPSSEGSISPASEWVNAGTVVSVSATPATGDQFTGFTGALSGATTPQNLTMNAPETVTANFSANGSPAWYNSAWSSRKPVTIPSTAGSASFPNFPVLISLPSDANLAASAQASGNDILFTASDRITKLNHEIELYNSANGQLIAWVQVPALSPGTAIYMYYGNSSASNQQNRTGTWNSNYNGVWHLPNGTTLSANDSTSHGNNGTLQGSTVPAATTGEIDGAASFNGSTANIQTPLNINTLPITVSAWVYPTITSGISEPWSTDAGGWDYGVEVNGGTWQVHVGNALVNTGVTANANTWANIALTYTTSDIVFYLNGSQAWHYGSGPGSLGTPSNLNIGESAYPGAWRWYTALCGLDR